MKAKPNLLFGSKNIMFPCPNKPPQEPKGTDLKKLKVCFIDNGLFVEFARTVAKDFGEAFYFTQAVQSDFANIKDALYGFGFPEMTRILSLFERSETYDYTTIDLYIFFDVGYAWEQYHLVELGYNVWGARTGEFFELFRVQQKEIMKKLGMNLGSYNVVVGKEERDKYLARQTETQYLKGSMWRNNFETFPYFSEDLSRNRLRKVDYDMGAAEKIFQYIIEKKIDADFEIGYDGFNIDGNYPSLTTLGYEIKGSCYGGRKIKHKALPEQVLKVCDELSPLFKDFGYRGKLSLEIRIDKNGKEFMIDPCCRFGSPVNEGEQALISNWGIIFWKGAHGIIEEPIYKAEYVLNIYIVSPLAQDDFLSMYFPDKIAEWIKPRKNCMIDGVMNTIPSRAKMTNVASIVSIGDSLDECINKAHEYEKEFKSEDTYIEWKAVDDLMKEIDNGQKQFNIKF